MCIRTMPAPASPTTLNIAGSAPAETSFTIVAPASSAARATAGLRVSTDTGTSGSSSAIRRITGTTRWISSSGATTSEPGRVDSPPTSTSSAPSATIWIACFTASSTLAYEPPSEKESGVTFTIPITRVRRPRGMTCEPQRQMASPGM
jgi:hypothetical protein